MMRAQEKSDGAEMLAAARLNWRLWTIIQAELLSPDCPVPADIRANVLSLSNFIDKHTVDFIRKPEAQKMDVLISINRELAGGLYATPEDGATDDGQASTRDSEAVSSAARAKRASA